MRPAWVEVNLNALRKNIRNLKKCTAHCADFMGVIKADAYGHGVLKVAQVLKEEGVKRFAVVIMQEGIELRENGLNEPVLILGHTLEEDYEEVIKYNLTPIIYKYSQAFELSETAKKMNTTATIHVKIDTGMGRLGFMPGEEMIKDIKRIAKLPNIFLEGIYSHLATADQIHGDYVRNQFAKFQAVIYELEKEGVKIPIKHIANSAATIYLPEMHLDMVRPGTSLYGLYPSAKLAENPTIELFPVMSIKSKLVHVKPVPIGTAVSYSGTFIAKRPSVLGVVPMGYVDGIFRQLANKGEVLVRGRRCPMVGNICMDQFMVDLTDLPEVQLGDEVVFLGEQGGDRITADEIGAKVSSISIEIVTRLGKRMPIVYVDC